VKKKKFLTDKDKADWLNFTKNLGSIENKDRDLKNPYEVTKKIKQLDLHGCSLSEANNKVKNFINKSYEENIRKLLIVTGKGLRSKAPKDPYRSKDMSILKNSVPYFIKNDNEISRKIIKISKAEQEDGGDGALYILLKNKF
tara:strand:- start:1116 stop:1541 length:426 start_codon:yes stop_codon:yes gene_type:complete